MPPGWHISIVQEWCFPDANEQKITSQVVEQRAIEYVDKGEKSFIIQSRYNKGLFSSVMYQRLLCIYHLSFSEWEFAF